MVRKYFIAASLAAALPSIALAAADSASNCQLGKIAEIPVTMSGERPMIHVGINGSNVEMELDSGAFYSTISPGSADDLQLKREPTPSWFYISGVGGRQNAWISKVKTLTISGIPVSNVEFLVGGSEVGSIGLFGDNILNVGDTEYDLAHGVVKLIRPKNCGKLPLVYWTAVGTSYSVINIDAVEPRQPHTIGEVFVNGVRMRAMFDTGAGASILKTSAAARLGIKPGQPGVVPAGSMGGIGRHRVDSWIAPFASFKIGDEEIKNTHLRIGDLGDSNFDMLLGPDFFLSHHIYVAHSQNKLYFTYNGGHVFDLSYKRPTTAQGMPNAAVAAADAKPAVANESESQPKTAGEYDQRGQARAARGDLDGGLADLDHAVALAPDNVDYLWQRAELRAHLRQPIAAVDDLARLLKIKPDHVDALLLRAEIRRTVDHDADIRSDVDAAAAAATKSSDRRIMIAGLYDALGDYPDAIAQYDLWIAAHPDDNKKLMALNGRCWARAMTGQDLDRALKDCNSALSMRPHTPAILDSRGLVHVRMGGYAKAIADYNEALAAKPDMAWSHYGRGIAELRVGETKEGEADLAEAAKLDSKLADKAKAFGIAP